MKDPHAPWVLLHESLLYFRSKLINTPLRNVATKNLLRGETMDYLKRSLLLSIFLVIVIFSESGFSYDFRVNGNIPLAGDITAVAVNTTTGNALAVSNDKRTLYLIDMTTNTVTGTITLNITASGVAIDCARNQAIVSSQDGLVNFIDLTAGALVKTASFEQNIYLATFDTDNDVLILGSDKSLLIVDPETENIKTEIALPGKALSANAIPDTGQLAVIVSGNPGLLLVDTKDPGSQAWIMTELSSSSFSINPSTNTAAMINGPDKSISIASLENNAIKATLALDNAPNAVAVDPTRSIALVAHKGGITTLKLENPVPVIEELIPSQSQVGVPGFDLILKGNRFLRDSTVSFNLKDLATSFDSMHQLRLFVSSQELLMTGVMPVAVSNPQPGGGMSKSMPFSILNTPPVIDAISPNQVALTATQVEVKIEGKNFLPNSTVTFNGSGTPVSFKSSTQLIATIALTGITVPAKYPLTVTNHSQVSLTSNTAFLEIADPETLVAQTSESSTINQDKDQSKPGQTGTLTGKILNTHREPIEGVTLRIRNVSTVTNAEGDFELRNIPSGKVLSWSTAQRL